MDELPEEIRDPRPRIMKTPSWRCPACHYNKNTREACESCGRTRWGDPDPAPGKPADHPITPGLGGRNA